MAGRRSREASKLEQSSQRCTCLTGMSTGIALLLLLLLSASSSPSILSSCLYTVFFTNHHEKAIKLLQRNHYNYDFNTLISQNVTGKAHFTTVHSKKVNRNAIRYRDNPAPYSTPTVQAKMPSLAKGKPTSSIKEATTKVKEKELNPKDKSTGKLTRPTKAQVAREAQVEKDAKLDTILEKEWKFDPVKDREPKAYGNSSGSSEYSGSDDDSSEWTDDNEGSNMIEDQPSDEELTGGRMKKKKLAEGEDSHANVITTAMIVNALTPDNNHHLQQQYSNKRDNRAKWNPPGRPGDTRGGCKTSSNPFDGAFGVEKMEGIEVAAVAKVLPLDKMATSKPHLVTMSKLSVTRAKMALEQDSYNDDEDGLLRWQGSSQVKNEEIVVDSEGSLRWRRRKRKQRRRKWC